MSAIGPSGLFAAIGIVAGLTTLFGVWRTVIRPSVPAGEQQVFQSLPRTTPMAAVLEAEDEIK